MFKLQVDSIRRLGIDPNDTEQLISFIEYANSVEDEIIRLQLFSFVGALAVAAGLFYLGYQIKEIRNPVIKIADSIEAINSKLGAILNVVNSLAPLIERVLEKIDLLVEEIRGVIRKETIDKTIAELNNSLDYLRQYMKNERQLKRAVQNGSMERILFGVSGSVNIINELGGLTGVLLSAPGMAMWAQGFSAQEKVFFEEESSTEMESVYDHEVHKRNFHHYKKFFEDVEKFGKEYQSHRSHPDYVNENILYEGKWQYPTSTLAH